jgi:hypothetical protein
LHGCSFFLQLAFLHIQTQPFQRQSLFNLQLLFRIIKHP